MANTKSQAKRNRQNERRRQHNKSARSELKTHVKAAETALAAGDDSAHEAVQAAQKRIGKAASKGTIHRNAAARRQSRLMRKGERG